MAVLIMPTPILAQDQGDPFARAEIVPASEETNPDYDPKPIIVGRYELRPEAMFSAGLNSNVLGTELNEIEDSFVGFTPAISLDSDYLRHALGAYIEVDHRENSDLSDESRTNLKIKLRGRLDLGEEISVVVQLSGVDETEDRLEPSNVPTSLEPNEYTKVGGAIGLGHQAGRIQLQAKLGFASYDYDDAELAEDLFQDQDFRDRDEITASGRLAYAVTPSNAVFAQAKVIQADYPEPNVFNAFNRDHTGTVLLVGTDFELGDNLRGDLGLGYQFYSYDDATFEDISDVAFAGRVDWRLAERTTLSAEAERAVIDPGVPLSNAAIETGASLRLEQGLTSKLSINGEAGFAQYAYETIDRDDDRVNLHLGANWKINQNIWLEGGYQIIDQTSDVQAFTDNRALLKMRIFP
jgi:hypothetical protein